MCGKQTKKKLVFNIKKKVVSCPSLKLSFGLLLRFQLVIKFLLEFLFGEVHFTNGSVVFYPPLASWRKGIQFRKCLCDI